MYDISASNLVSVSLQTAGGGWGAGIELDKRDFSADSSPVRIEPLEVVNTEIDINKRLFPRRRYRVVRVTLTPIPNTKSDNRLKDLLFEARQHSSESNGANVTRMDITYAQAGNDFGGGVSENKITLEDGFIISGNLGIDLMPEGRFASTPYIFEFADIDGKLEVDNPWTLEGEFQILDERGNQSSSQTTRQPPKQRKPQLPKSVQNSLYFGTNSKGQEVRGNWYNGNVINGRVYGG